MVEPIYQQISKIKEVKNRDKNMKNILKFNIHNANTARYLVHHSCEHGCNK